MADTRRCANPLCEHGPGGSRGILEGRSARTTYCDSTCRSEASRYRTEHRPRPGKRPDTQYVVLRGSAAAGFHVSGLVMGHSAGDAVRQVANGDNGGSQYVAIPARSFKPMVV